MTSTRCGWARFLLAGLSIALAPVGFPSARAQGFGPDPFQPFNSQFQQFTYPISPYAGGPGAAAGAMGGRVDNQYQQYLKELEGADRALNQRYGIGVQYWKLRSDIDLDKRDQLKRRMARQNDGGAASISQKYLAYFSERNPRKRASLMREFASNRRSEARAGGETEDGEAGLDSGRPVRGAGGLSGNGGRSGASSLQGDSAKSGDAKSGRSTAPSAPACTIPCRRNGPDSCRPATDVLERSRRLDDDLPGTRKPAASDRRNTDRPASSSPDD